MCKSVCVILENDEIVVLPGGDYQEGVNDLMETLFKRYFCASMAEGKIPKQALADLTPIIVNAAFEGTDERSAKVLACVGLLNMMEGFVFPVPKLIGKDNNAQYCVACGFALLRKEEQEGLCELCQVTTPIYCVRCGGLIQHEDHPCCDQSSGQFYLLLENLLLLPDETKPLYCGHCGNQVFQGDGHRCSGMPPHQLSLPFWRKAA